MSWTDLFKSKKNDPDPRIRWFGKLPTYADYYTSKTDESWAVEFNDWVLKGYEVLRLRMPESGKGGKPLPLSACVIRLPKSEMTVLAAIMDYGGDMRGRPFPMCFYVGIPTSQWSGPTAGQVNGAARVIRDLLSLRREVTRFMNSPGRFEDIFADRQISLAALDAERVDDSWERDARSIALSQWFEAIRSGVKIDNSDEWFRIVTSWGDSIARLESKDFEPTLRFPLAAGIGVELQLAGWIRWLESRIDLSRRAYSLMVTGDVEESGGQLSIVARELLPDDFLLMSDLAATLSYVDDVSRSTVDGTHSGALSDGGFSRRFDLSGAWSDFAASTATPT